MTSQLLWNDTLQVKEDNSAHTLIHASMHTRECTVNKKKCLIISFYLSCFLIVNTDIDCVCIDIDSGTDASPKWIWWTVNMSHDPSLTESTAHEWNKWSLFLFDLRFVYERKSLKYMNTYNTQFRFHSRSSFFYFKCMTPLAQSATRP